MPLDASSRLHSITALYDARSNTYDENHVHVDQARDYLVWAGLRPGQNVLDLACGTGLVTLGAKSTVGDSGVVVGVDVSPGMLDEGRRKADRAGLQVRFLEGDIQHVDEVLLVGASTTSTANEVTPSNSFDVITCASALILLDDPVDALRRWKPLLKRPGGKLVTDVQTRSANLLMNVFRHVAGHLGTSVLWDGGAARYEAIEDLASVVRDAGYHVDRLFETRAYATTTYKLDEAGEIFDRAVDEKEMFAQFAGTEGGVRERAKALFVQRMNDLSGGKDSLLEETRFWVVVASVPDDTTT
ncbi:hypothetical protein PV08_02687 [Exophiala spinifera]|uniref:Methyltransferase domain-containing protein n=1 Tax=Exophiala spinifera TaxID=91928 RepID=A0A0D2C447_9EURO|nr:uncharacterized protein PV08_02687 [Exophiala spinifera]KIW18399.1 hypothetical protein PV08_02687 [Exophiala spinifera]